MGFRVYFAHPCFNKRQERFKKRFIKRVNESLKKGEYAQFVKIVDPFRYVPDIERIWETKMKMSKTVTTICLQVLEECDLVVALADGKDTGVAFEMGYAHCMHVPIILVSEKACHEVNSMLIGSVKEMFDRVFDDEQMERLVGMIEWFVISKSRRPSSPVSN